MGVPQINFAKGEVAEELRARFDVQAYPSSVRRARNVRVKKYGGLEKRPGTRFVAEVYDDSAPVRLAPFQFSLTQTYALEWGQGYMRVASNGGMVLNEELAVTGLSSANPVTVTAAYHGYSAGDQVYFSGQVGAWEVLNGRFFDVIASTGTDTFTIDFNGSGFAAWTASTGGITRVGAPDPDPTPPVVPPPVDPPEPPVVGGGGRCVADDTMILMANRSLIMARDLVVGDMVRTKHEETLRWGSYRVSGISFAERAVWRVNVDGRELVASTGHRVMIDGKWLAIDTIGNPAGTATVAMITVDDAHTYVSNGILSHNIKQYDPEEPV
jgi:hypothetical protein